MLTLIVRLAQTRAMIALAIVWAIVFGAILITMGQLAEATGGSGILDFEVGYSAERVAAILGSYGAEGMALYGRIQLLDLINPALYSLLLAAITHRLYRDTGPAWIALVPLLGGLGDYLENATLFLIVRAYPELPDGLVGLSSTLSLLKNGLLVVALLPLILGLVRLARGRR